METSILKATYKSDQELLYEVPKSFFDIKAIDIDGNLIDFGSFKNKYNVYLITNVACKCGLTSSSYRELVELHKKYKDHGFVILALPCNQFFKQEDKDEDYIKQFAQQKFGVTFPMFSKIEVNGEKAHPLFKYLRYNSILYDKKTDKAKQIPWNFAKFLVDQNGKVVSFYEPHIKPLKLEDEIKKLLGIN